MNYNKKLINNLLSVSLLNIFIYIDLLSNIKKIINIPSNIIQIVFKKFLYKSIIFLLFLFLLNKYL